MIGEGLVKSIFFHAITIVVVELMLQLEEDIASSLPPSAQARTSRAPYRAIQDMLKLTTDRLRMRENNTVGPVFLSAAAALINAINNGISPEEVVPEAANKSAQECLEILRARLKNVPQGEVQGQYCTLVTILK